MLEKKSQLCGLLLAISLFSAAAVAQTTQASPPKPETAPAQTDSAIDADVVVPGTDACPSPGPSADWYNRQNVYLLETIGAASSDADAAKQAELRYERAHRITRPVDILSTRVWTLRKMLTASGQGQ